MNKDLENAIKAVSSKITQLHREYGAITSNPLHTNVLRQEGGSLETTHFHDSLLAQSITTTEGDQRYRLQLILTKSEVGAFLYNDTKPNRPRVVATTTSPDSALDVEEHMARRRPTKKRIQEEGMPAAIKAAATDGWMRIMNLPAASYGVSE